MFKASDLQAIEELLLSFLTIITLKITPNSRQLLLQVVEHLQDLVAYQLMC